MIDDIITSYVHAAETGSFLFAVRYHFRWSWDEFCGSSGGRVDVLRTTGTLCGANNLFLCTH